MGKVIKYILWVILALIILAAIGIGILVYTVNPNTLKAPITQQVESITGRKLTIVGNINWKFLPWLGVSIKQIQLSNAPGFDQSKPFMSLKDADVDVKFFPLLRGSIEFGKIKLEGLALNLSTNAQGLNNWSDLLKDNHAQLSTKTPPQPTATPSDEKSKLNLKPLDLTISSIEISDANISYDNQKTNENYNLSDFNLSSQDIRFNRSFPIDMSFSFNSTSPNLYGQINLNTRVAINLNQQTLTINPFVINATLNGKNLPKNGVAINLQSSIALDQKQATLNLNNLAGQIANLQFSGKIDGVDIFKEPILNGTFNIAKFNPSEFLKNLGMSIPKFKSADAFTNMALNSDFIITPAAVTINTLKLNLDQSTLTGHAYLAMSNKNQSNFDFTLDKINASDYLPSTNTSVNKEPAKFNATTTPLSTSTKNNGANATASQLIPVKPLRQLNLAGKFTIKQLTFNQLKATDINLNVNANNGIIQMVNNNANLYQGQWLSNMALNVQTPTPIIQINEALNHVQIEPLSQAFYNSKNLQITGTADIKTSVTTQGNNSQSLIKNLNGNSQFSLTNGVIKGVNIGYQLDRALALVNKQTPPQPPANNQTPFGSLTGTLQIQNGLVRNNDLLLNSNAMKVTGKGYANLVTQRLHYELAASVNQNGVASQVYALQQKIGGSVPLVLSGTFEKYKIYPNIEVILKNLAVNYLQQNTKQINNSVNKNIKNLGDQLQKGLKGLFN